jgi:hypothetical protein
LLSVKLHRFTRVYPALLLAFSAVVCAPSSDPLGPLPQAQPGRGINVLFIGNSLTYVNDLPATLMAIGAAAHDTIHAAAVAAANYALIDHTKQGDALRAIQRGGWDFVVLQQGPTSSTSPSDRDTLILATRIFDREAREAGARTALYMVWPARARLEFFDNVRAAYRAAADSVGGRFFPAGEAWRIAWEAEPALALYGADGFHPSSLGTFLAALVIYQGVTGKDARTLPARAFANGTPFSLPEKTIRLLQDAAHQAMTEYGR